MEHAHGIVARVQQLVTLLRVPDRPFRLSVEAPRQGCRHSRPARVEPEQVERGANDTANLLTHASHEVGTRAARPTWIQKDGTAVVRFVCRGDHPDGDGGRGPVWCVVVEG